jgi:putative ABC transport system permease protein
MLLLFRDRKRDAAASGSWFAALRFWHRSLRDMLGEACLEWWRVVRGPSDSALGSVQLGRPVGRANRSSLFDVLSQDVEYAVRAFVRTPGFTFTALLTLALGIGANTAIFSVVNGVLLRPLRFGEPDRLVTAWEFNPTEPAESGRSSRGLFQDWRNNNDTFADLTAWTWDSFILLGEQESVSLNGALVYPNFFSVLRAYPLLGRPFTPDDAEPGRRGTVMVVSHRLWRERWGSNPDVVGRTVTLDGAPVTIVGVMGPQVAVPHVDVDVWLPVAFRSELWYDRHERVLEVYGRLAPGVTVEQAQRDLSRIERNLAIGEYASVYEGWDARVTSLRAQMLGDVTATLVVAFVAVTLVLVIACVNIANMLLARASVRGREMALRAALGAGKARLVRQLLIESVALALAGGLLGVGFAYLTHNLILSTEPGILPRVEELALDWQALGFAAFVSFVTGLLFGIAPAVHGARVDLQQSLAEGRAFGSTSSRRHGRARAFLVTSQLALTLVLLCCSGLLIRTMVELRSVDPGFDAHRTVAARFFLDGKRYDTVEKLRVYFEQLEQRLAAEPGIEAVGSSTALPMDPVGVAYDLPYRVEGREDLADGELPQADFRVVTPGYFETLGIPLVEGRTFDSFDGPDAPFVAVVNEAMAREVWPGREAIGERFYTPSTQWRWFEVVGVAGDTRQHGLHQVPRAEMYVPHSQVPRSYMTVVVRAGGDPGELSSTLRSVVQEVDPAQPPHSIIPVSTIVADTVAAERFYMIVLGVFAAIALVLSAVGVYGVLSYWVNQRTHEIGVRLALGARRSEVVKHVVSQAMTLVAAGILLGLAGAVISTRVLEAVLFEVSTMDLATFVGVTVTLTLVALLACSVPALRASRVDPMTAFRD